MTVEAREKPGNDPRKAEDPATGPVVMPCGCPGSRAENRQKLCQASVRLDDLQNQTLKIQVGLTVAHWTWTDIKVTRCIRCTRHSVIDITTFLT